MILYAFTANPDLLPKNQWLQKAPLFEGGEPKWTAGVTSYGPVFWSVPNPVQGVQPFVLVSPPCQCALLPPEMGEKWVEDGEMWIDLDNHYAVDIYGPTTTAHLRAFLAAHGIKVTLNRLLTILAMDGKEVLKRLTKWNAIAEEHQAKKQAALAQHFAQPHTATDMADLIEDFETDQPITGKIVTWSTSPAPATNPVKTLYEELMAGTIKVKPKLSPYKWVLSKGVVVRPDANKAADDDLKAKLKALDSAQPEF